MEIHSCRNTERFVLCRMLRIINISDLHYQKGWDEECELVWKRFAEDVVSTPFDGRTIIVFSGDLVQSGDSFENYHILRDKLNQLKAKVGISDEDMIFVPGNHDVQRSEITKQKLAHSGAIMQIEDELQFNNELEGELKSILKPKFNNYAEFLKDFCPTLEELNCYLEGGIEIDKTRSFYVLNTALCSHGGINSINDEGKLSINTRDLHRWLNETNYELRILIMHHPSSWLTNWAQKELECIINQNFDIVISGHVHSQDIQFIKSSQSQTLTCSAPPLFTRKKEKLGYTSIQVKGSSEAIITYRQWSRRSGFVLGTIMAGNDSGTISHSFEKMKPSTAVVASSGLPQKSVSTIDILEHDFVEAATCFRKYHGRWIERNFSHTPESSASGRDTVMLGIDDLIKLNKDFIIRSPSEFGLSSVGRQYALRKAKAYKEFFVTVDMNHLKAYPRAISKEVEKEIQRLLLTKEQLKGVIIDNFKPSDGFTKTLKFLKELYPDCQIVALHCHEELLYSPNIEGGESIENFEKIYLWTLSKQALRSLVNEYGEEQISTSNETLLKNILSGLDSLNIPRTPLNCFTLLRICEHEGASAPINRTDLISKTLTYIFSECDSIPRYESTPDKMDCEFALGIFTANLLKKGVFHFKKQLFFLEIERINEEKLLSIEADILLLVLSSEGVVVKVEEHYEFRFGVWFYYFAAQGMKNDPEFATYILENKRYAAYPLLLEFYSGFDRKRDDAVKVLIQDLQEFDECFKERTKISDDLNPFDILQWRSSDEHIQAMEEDINNGMPTTELSALEKDLQADKTFDRGKAYRQRIAKLIESSLTEYTHATQGAARVLRNSGYVDPLLRKQLLEKIMTSWTRVAQSLVLISHSLVKNDYGSIDGAGFYLEEGFPDDPSLKLQSIIKSIPQNVICWNYEDIASHKLAALFCDYLKSNNTGNQIGSILLRRLVITQRPEGWSTVLQEFVDQASPNSYALYDAQSALRIQLAHADITEKNRAKLKALLKTSIAKHITGKKKPSAKSIARIGRANKIEKL